MDAFELLFMVFVLGAVFGGVVGAVCCSCARREEADFDVSEHGNQPL